MVCTHIPSLFRKIYQEPYHSYRSLAKKKKGGSIQLKSLSLLSYQCQRFFCFSLWARFSYGNTISLFSADHKDNTLVDAGTLDQMVVEEKPM